MPNDLRKLLENSQVYYTRMLEALRPAHEKTLLEQKQILSGLYRQVAEMETRLKSMEADFGYVYRPETANPARSSHKADIDPDGDWDDMWANDDLQKFGDHFNRHAKDFGAKDWNDYARKSQDFFKQGQDKKFPTVETKDGYTKMYDPKTNSYGSYDPEGKTNTFFKPTSPTYYQRESAELVKDGGRVINPLPGPEDSGSGGLVGGGRGTSPFEKPGQIMHPGDQLPEE